MAHVYKEAFIKMVSAVLLELPNIKDLENPRDGGAWWAAVLWGHTESDTTEVTYPLATGSQSRKGAIAAPE